MYVGTIDSLRSRFPACQSYSLYCTASGFSIQAGIADPTVIQRIRHLQGAKPCLSPLWNGCFGPFLRLSNFLDRIALPRWMRRRLSPRPQPNLTFLPLFRWSDNRRSKYGHWLGHTQTKFANRSR